MNQPLVTFTPPAIETSFKTKRPFETQEASSDTHVDSKKTMKVGKADPVEQSRFRLSTKETAPSKSSSEQHSLAKKQTTATTHAPTSVPATSHGFYYIDCTPVATVTQIQRMPTTGERIRYAVGDDGKHHRAYTLNNVKALTLYFNDDPRPLDRNRYGDISDTIECVNGYFECKRTILDNGIVKRLYLKSELDNPKLTLKRQPAKIKNKNNEHLYKNLIASKTDPSTSRKIIIGYQPSLIKPSENESVETTTSRQSEQNPSLSHQSQHSDDDSFNRPKKTSVTSHPKSSKKESYKLLKLFPEQIDQLRKRLSIFESITVGYIPSPVMPTVKDAVIEPPVDTVETTTSKQLEHDPILQPLEFFKDITLPSFDLPETVPLETSEAANLNLDPDMPLDEFPFIGLDGLNEMAVPNEVEGQEILTRLYKA